MKFTNVELIMSRTDDIEDCFTLPKIKRVLAQASVPGTVQSITFMGADPFQHYPVLVQGVALAHALGFRTTVETSGYWATTADDFVLWTSPLSDAGLDEMVIHRHAGPDEIAGRRDPESIRVDGRGDVRAPSGETIGNLFDESLWTSMERYEARTRRPRAVRTHVPPVENGDAPWAKGTSARAMTLSRRETDAAQSVHA